MGNVDKIGCVYGSEMITKGSYEIKLTVHSQLTDHLYIGLVREELKDSKNFTNSMYHCITCKQDHSKFMKRLSQKSIVEKYRPGNTIVVKIAIDENAFNITDENDSVLISNTDVEL